MNLKRSFLGVHHLFHKLTLLVVDLLCIAVAFYVATQLRLHTLPQFLTFEYFGINLIIVFCLFIGGVYTSAGMGSAPSLPLKTFFVVLASALPCTFFIYVLGPERFNALFGRGVFPFAILELGILAVISRYVINRAFSHQTSAKQVLLLGTIAAQEHISEALGAGQLNIDMQHTEYLDPNIQIEGNLHAIVISPDHLPNDIEQQALIKCRLAGIPIFSLSDFFESFLFLVPVQEINNDWFIRAEGFTMLHSSVTTRVKRAVDVLVALLLLIVTAPVTLLTGLMIKLTSRGPALFSQTRVGIEGKPFTLYKFRTMKVNAEQNGAQWASNDDPRILPIGRFLRTSRIDELPQCWNILKGEMSVVGPRPERPEFTSMLSKKIPYYDLRHVIKPGLTGWAQVMYRYGASADDALKKLQFDLYYIKNYSLLLDLNILLRTVLITLRRKGR